MKYFRYLLVLYLVVVLLYFFFRNVEFEKVVEILKSVNVLYIAVFIIGLYSQFFIRGYRWGILFRPYKRKISIFNLYHYTMIGMFINTLLPGRVGEPARGILIARDEGLDSSSGLATIVIERMIDFLMIIVLFFVSLVFIDSKNSKFLSELKSGAVIFLPIVLSVFLIFYLINVPRIYGIVEKVIKFFMKIVPEKVREKVTDFILNFIRGLKLQLNTIDSIKLIFSSVLVWLYLVPFYWVLMQGFKFGSSITVLETIPYFSLIVISAAIPTPGMAGSLDAASKHGLIGLYKDSVGNSIVSVNEAAAFTLLVHVLIILVIMIPGIISFTSKGLKLSTIKKVGRKKNEMSGM